MPTGSRRSWGITIFLTIISALLATIVNAALQWKGTGVIVSSYSTVVFVGIISWLLSSWHRVMTAVETTQTQIDNKIEQLLGIDGSVRPLADIIKNEVRSCTINAPVGFSRNFQDIVRTIFSIGSTDMQTEVINFTIKALDNIKQKNGFSLSEQPFAVYRKKAIKFYKASQKSIKMTCLYSPLDYLMTLNDQAELDPTHLELFNGMDKSVDPDRPRDLVRIRVMYVKDKLLVELSKVPTVFAASIVWFFFHNINFDKLYWSTNTPPPVDIIIFDGKHMYKYAPAASILYLKCAWEGIAGPEPLDEDNRYFSGDSVAGYSDTFNKFIHILDNDSNGSLWDSFKTELEGYLRTIESDTKKLAESSPHGFRFYKDYATKLLKELKQHDRRYDLLQWMKNIHNETKSNNPKDAENLCEFMLNDFDVHIEEYYPGQFDEARSIWGRKS